MKVSARLEQIDCEGYTKCGLYFGLNQSNAFYETEYCYAIIAPEGNTLAHIRAISRAEAIDSYEVGYKAAFI